MQCKKYVVGALYGDTNAYIYSFSKKEEWIELNPIMEKFIRDNKEQIESLNYYKWAKFYENVNDMETTIRVQKLIDSKVARKNESVYRTILASEFERDDIKNGPKLNTLELLWGQKEAEPKEEKLIESDYQEEIYRDIEHFKQYINDPIRLLTELRKNKGI